MRSSRRSLSPLRLWVAVSLPTLLVLTTPAPSLAAPTGPGVVATRAADPVARVVVPNRAHPTVRLEWVGSRYVRTAIPIKGHTSHLGQGRHKLVVQRLAPGTRRWSNRATAYVRTGAYRFSAQYVGKPGRVKFRTVAYTRGRRVDVSNVVTVRVVARPSQPSTTVQRRTISTANCPQLTVTGHREVRTIRWRWSTVAKSWVPAPTPWATIPGTTTQRPAGVADCVRVVSGVPAGAALPDLRIKDLTKCGLGDSLATGGTCFLIDPSAPAVAAFPSLTGRKLLKFGVITLNVGAGPSEIIADRSAPSATDWRAFQNFYDTSGTLLGSTADPDAQFYFAGDGHNHWHIRDFDDYQLLDAGGTTVARAEKHGYCIQDNTTYQPLQGQPGVPDQAVYSEATSCGKALTGALAIVHGLSRGWGDTYPTSLPDQAIDITGLPDGEYTVRVVADGLGVVTESDDANNVAEVKVQISGNTVTVVPGTSSGGLP